MLRKKYIRGLLVFSAVIVAFSCFGITASAEKVSSVSGFNGSIYAVIDGTKSKKTSISGDTVTITFNNSITAGTYVITYYFMTNNAISSAVYQGFNGTFKYLDDCCFNHYDPDSDSASLDYFSMFAFYEGDSGSVYLEGSVQPQSWGYRFSFNSGEYYIDKPLFYEINVRISCHNAISKISFSFSEFEYIFETDSEKSTDEILYDWDNSGASPDSSSFDELDGLEDGISNSTGKLLIGFDSAGNPIYDEGTLSDLGNKSLSTMFGGLMEYMNNPKALMALTSFVSDLAYTPEIATVLTYSLALAVIPLILGLGI